MKFVCYSIKHSTVYDYTGPVSESRQVVKLRPRNLSSQRCLSHDLRVQPTPNKTDSYMDYFGNPCVQFAIEIPHERLTVVAESRVAISLPFQPDPSETPPWEVVRSQVVTDHSAHALESLEFVFESPMIRTQAEIQAFARESFLPNRPLMDAALDLNHRIFSEFQFDPSATDVTTPVSQVLKEKRGVCQDFAHFAIACFRSLGLPARYVSGYLETLPPPGCEKLVGSDASHAWLAFFCPGLGWIELDPTNGCTPSMQHIKIGWGRDYADICPLSGIIKGAEGHQLSVAVDVISQGETSEP